jgi:hypothetical protein
MFEWRGILRPYYKTKNLSELSNRFGPILIPSTIATVDTRSFKIYHASCTPSWICANLSCTHAHSSSSGPPSGGWGSYRVGYFMIVRARIGHSHAHYQENGSVLASHGGALF